MRQHLALTSIRSSKRLCHYRNIGCRTLTTSRPLYDDKTEIVSGTPGGVITPEGTVSLKDLADVGIDQVALEAGSNSGLAFIGNNVLGAFDYIKGWLPSFGKGEVVWNDVVIPKLTHLYIPSIYETVQYYSGAQWFLIIGLGTLTLRACLLPLTRRTLRIAPLLRDRIPTYQSYGDMAKVLKKNNQQETAKKVLKWQQEIAKNMNGGSTMVAFVANGLIMMSINRGLRHLGHLTPLLDGGFGPFLDMTVNSNASVGFYCLPICIVTALGTIMHVNFRHEKWYNPRLYLVITPLGGIFAYFIGKSSVVMCLHYAISCWCTAILNIIQRTNHDLLKLPPPYKPSPPPENIRLSRELPRLEPLVPITMDDITDNKKSDFAAEDLSGISPKRFQRHNEKSELEFLEELTGKKSEETPKRSIGFETPYSPIFKLGQHDEETVVAQDNLPVGDNIPPPPAPPGIMQKAVDSAPSFKFRKRVRAWYFRQKLMRHGKKGNMKLFLEDAPPEMNFIQDSVQLTTKVTPGLKKYVLRRQYPMKTLDEMERKVSYVERVQNQRW